MRVRKLALAVGLVSALGGNAALALGLDEIKLNSTLNQPLDAEIGLLQTRGLGDGEIKVRLASPEDFERAGVDRSYLLSELHFDVDYSGGQPVIRVSSRVPIREPFLNFLVETRWPSGRLLREYTLLMDLPAFSGSTAQQPVRAAERERQQVRRDAPQPRPQPAPQSQAQQQLPAQQQQQAPQPDTPEEPAEQQRVQVRDVEESQWPAEEPVELRREQQAAAAETADSGSRVYGPVAANQTLWEIALESRAATGASVQQTMLAIQRLNPEAFIDNNINLLKKGAVLRLPETGDLGEFTLSQAISEVAMQNDAWRQRLGDDVATGAPLDARAVAEDSSANETVEGRVSLAAPGDNESVTSGSGAGAEDSEAMAGELAVTEEELDKSELENAELKERLSELDEQIDTMETLVEVSNEEMRAVQAAAEESEPSANPLEVGADETAAEDETTAEDEVVVEPAAEEEQTAPQEDENRNRVVVQTRPEPTLVDQLMEHIQLIGIGVGGLLLLLAGFFTWRRRREEAEAIMQVEREMAAERQLAEAPEVGSAPDENLATLQSMEADDNFDLGGLADVGTDDPISEAEIHLSLGQHNEAEQKLLAGLARDGQNVDARLMLLEVYAHRQDTARFDEHYRQLLNISDGPAADRAARLRESIAGAPPFDGPEMDFSSESIEAAQLDDMSSALDDDFSSDTFGSGESAGDADSGFGAQAEGDTSLLDDLTMDLTGGSGTEAGREEDDFSLDLDGGLDSTSATEQEDADGEFNFDDLDLGDLDLGSDDSPGSAGETHDLGPIEYDGGESGAEEEAGGLDFDLDLSPADDGDSRQSETPGESTAAEELTLDIDDLDSIGGELEGGLDLDSVDLDDITGDLSSDRELSHGGDTAVAERPTQVATEESGADLGDLSFNLESDLDSELNLLEGSDEVSTKLELAQAYLDMGDKDGAKDILNEVAQEGTGEHKARAEEMLERIA